MSQHHNGERGEAGVGRGRKTEGELLRRCLQDIIKTGGKAALCEPRKSPAESGPVA